MQRPYVLDWRSLLSGPQTDWTGDIHCVTRWSKFGMQWRGVSVKALLERAQLREGGEPFAGCGSRRNGSTAWRSSKVIDWASGRRTATTTGATPGARSATASMSTLCERGGAGSVAGTVPSARPQRAGAPSLALPAGPESGLSSDRETAGRSVQAALTSVDKAGPH
ncbi:MAG: hypothetical protein WBP81_34585 [Solirubrobacteraceae bacterium]